MEYTLKTIIKKRDYELALNAYKSKSWIKRLWLLVTGRKPKDPAPGNSLGEILALVYFRLNSENNLRNRINHGYDSVYARIKWNDETKLPVVMCTICLDGCFYEERKAFNQDGSKNEWGIAYPFSECGVTGLPQRIPDWAISTVKSYRKALSDVETLLRNINVN